MNGFGPWKAENILFPLANAWPFLSILSIKDIKITWHLHLQNLSPQLKELIVLGILSSILLIPKGTSHSNT